MDTPEHTDRPNRAWHARRIVTAGALLAACACVVEPPKGPLAWKPDRRVAGAVAPGATMVLLDSGTPAMRLAWTPERWPDDPLACVGTFVAAHGRGDTVYAVWRTGRDSSRSEVRLARSANAGLEWDPPITPVAGDPAPAGCTRPAPAIASDTAASAVHVVYHGNADGHTGLFVSSLNSTTATFGLPMIVSMGDRPVPAAIAATGDTIAVVFEAPANATGVMWLAISVGPRHIQTVHEVLSGRGVRVFSPGVALGGGWVGAAWNEARQGNDAPTAVARVGRWVR